MEELCQGLLSLLGANHAAAQQRRLLGRYGQMLERLLETQDGAEHQLRGEGGGEAGTQALLWGGCGQAGRQSPSLPPSRVPPTLCQLPLGLAGGRCSLGASVSPPVTWAAGQQPPSGFSGEERGWASGAAPSAR